MVLLGTIQGGPDGVPDEQATRFDVILFVQGKPVVNTLWKGYQVAGAHRDADPPVLAVPHVEVAGAIQYIAHLFVRVQMLGEEDFDFVLEI